MAALLVRKHVNVVAVALANKTARVAWAMVRNDKAYDPKLVTGSLHPERYAARDIA
jgi:transposase